MKRVHLFRPGPLYWDFKCLECDGTREEHVGIFYVVWRWLMGHRSAA